ncbi:uncharacterized mitochondrial protein-like protein [Tanacetum coccineum]|uniref:Uncharacterized mitochondrial protein-like protein n=1 Tax=Tanacetum coccineum TaxID=301880 RepID=A0ABQ5GMH7_9ASTR
MSSMGELTFFLGLQVKQKPNGIFISQDKYVAEILKKFDFASVKTASTPIETQKPLVKDEEASDVDVHLYRIPNDLAPFMYANPNWAFGILESLHLTWNPTQIVIMLEQILTGNPQQEVVNFLAGDSLLGNAKSKPLWPLLQQKPNMLRSGSSVDERAKTHHGKSNLFQETPKPLCSTFLPTDIKHCLNVGYTFVNFTTSEAAWKFHVCITRKSWLLFKSKKIAQCSRGLDSVIRSAKAGAHHRARTAHHNRTISSINSIHPNRHKTHTHSQFQQASHTGNTQHQRGIIRQFTVTTARHTVSHKSSRHLDHITTKATTAIQRTQIVTAARQHTITQHAFTKHQDSSAQFNNNRGLTQHQTAETTYPLTFSTTQCTDIT